MKCTAHIAAMSAISLLVACGDDAPTADADAASDITTSDIVDASPPEDVTADTDTSSVPNDVGGDVDPGAAQRARALTAQFGACTNATDIDALANLVIGQTPPCGSCGDDECVRMCAEDLGLTTGCTDCVVQVATCQTACDTCGEDGLTPSCVCGECALAFDACAGVHVEAGPAHAPAGPSFACSDDARRYAQSEAFPIDAAACECDNADCWNACLPTLDPCGECVDDYATCAPRWCEDACAIDGFSEACTACAATCADRFWTCVDAPDGAFAYPAPPVVTARLIHIAPNLPFVSVIQQADGAPIFRLARRFQATEYQTVDASSGGLAATEGSIGPLATPVATTPEDLIEDGTYSLAVWWRGDIPRLTVLPDPGDEPGQWRVFNGSPANEVTVLDDDAPLADGWANVPQGTLSPALSFDVIPDVLRLDLDGDDIADVGFNRPGTSAQDIVVLWIYEREDGMRLFMTTSFGTTADMPPLTD